MKDEADIVSELADVFASLKRESFIDRVNCASTRCESPIERVLLCALLVADANGPELITMIDADRPLAFEELKQYVDRPRYSDQIIVIYPQCRIGDYRVDFYLEEIDITTRKAWHKVVIECDGHEFHEKTKEQARRDKQRDRWFQSRGIAVYRFAGSEIWSNPVACAEQLFGALFQAFRRQFPSPLGPAS